MVKNVYTGDMYLLILRQKKCDAKESDGCTIFLNDCDI